MTGAAFRLGFGEDLAPRVPVALFSVAFLIFFQWILSREFGARAAWAATLILGTRRRWLGCSFIGSYGSAHGGGVLGGHAALARMDRNGRPAPLPLAAALLGAAVLAKGLCRWCSACRWCGAAGGAGKICCACPQWGPS
jgi:hypothetical protein